MDNQDLSPEALEVLNYSVEGDDNERFKRKPTMIPISATNNANLKENPELFGYLRLLSSSYEKEWRQLWLASVVMAHSQSNKLCFHMKICLLIQYVNSSPVSSLKIINHKRGKKKVL